MARFIEKPTAVKADGTPPKEIQEYVGLVNTGTAEVSIAKMTSPAGWSEPGQTPDFNEYTTVLKGSIRVKSMDREWTVKAGQSFMAEAGEWVQYSTPEGAEYVAVCLPAFSPGKAHRD